MKKITKVKASLTKASLTGLIAFAVITALVISCAPPDLEVTNYDWKTANERNDPSKSDSSGINFTNSFTVTTTPSSANKPEITITFPAQSDFLRAANVEAGLKAFLTVHNFETIPADTNGTDGKASPLTAAVDYSLVKAAGTSITIKVDKDYTAAGTGDYSNLVLKIDGTKYKHSGGLLMDYDGNGKAGEALYDDVYRTVTVPSATLTSFTAPGNRGWYITLSAPSGFTFTDDSTTSDNTTVTAAQFLYNSGISTTTVNGKAIYAAIADLVVSNIKIEKLGANGVWTAESAVAVYDATNASYTNYILFKDFKAEHGAVYRVTWKGSANIETAAEYFDVKQRLYVTGSTPNTSSYTTKARYALTQVSGAAAPVINSSIVTYIAATDNDFTVTPFAYDANNKNVVLELKIADFRGDGTTADPYVGLDASVINDLSKFKASFRIVRSPSEIYNISSLWSNANLTYLDITKVEGIANPVTTGSATTAINILRITLDPKAAYNAGLEKKIIPIWC